MCMNIIEQIKKRKKLSIILGVFLAIVIFGVVRAAMPNSPEITSAKAEKKYLVQSVSETGQVMSDINLKYGWESSGRVISILKKPGEFVNKGDVIALVEQTKQRARLSEGLASLSSSQARLNLEIAGPSDHDRKKSSASVDQAIANLAQRETELEKIKIQAEKNIDTAQRNLISAENDLQRIQGGEQSQIVTDAYANVVEALKSSLVTFRSALTDADAVMGIDNQYANDDYKIIDNSLYFNTAQISFYDSKQKITDAEKKVFLLSSVSDKKEVDAASILVGAVANTVQRHLFDVNNVLVSTLPGADLSQTELETLISSIATARSSVATASANLVKNQQALTTARNSLSTYRIAYEKAAFDLESVKKQAETDIFIAEAILRAGEANLASVKAQHESFISPPRPVDIAGLRADVARQAASVQALRDDVAKTELIALADGVIGKLDIEVGETAIQNEPVLTLISPTLSVKVDISESDISKVSLKDTAAITLDAFGDAVSLMGTVASIEPGETEVSGVIYYKTTIVLDDTKGQDIRSGMTANVSITTETKSDALVIPQRAVLSQDGKQIVRVLTNKKRGTFAEREVHTGLKGDNGMVEIISGISEGEEVITFLKEKK